MNVIIAGAAKAATSSVFSYLSAHPEVCGSSVKETAFFQKQCTGHLESDQENYADYFSHCKKREHIFVEASAGYMVCDDIVLEAILSTLKEVKIIFILRNPIDRLYSYYNFHVNQLRIPHDIDFESYVDMCQIYYRHGKAPEGSCFEERHLKALKQGRYAEYLPRFIATFGSANLNVLFFEDLKQNPRTFMRKLSSWLHIDPNFYNSYSFHRVNVNFSSKIKILHNFALRTNILLEKYLRQRPTVKKFLVTVYKYLNQAKEGYTPMSDITKDKLTAFYQDSNRQLVKILNKIDHYPDWLQKLKIAR